MSSPIRDCGEAHRELGIQLNEFLYVNGRPPKENGKNGVKREHTYEELWDMLESIRTGAWSDYDDIAHELGWDN